MMSKCAKCGTAWTSLGMTMCPMCGAKVDPPAGVSESGRHVRVAAPRPPVAEPPKPVLMAVSIAPDLGLVVPRMSAEPDKSTSSVGAEPPPPPPKPKVPSPKTVESLPPMEIDHAATAISDFGFDQLPISEPDRSKKPAGRMGEDESWYCSLPPIDAPPAKRPEPVLKRHLPIRPVPEPGTERVDGSVVAARIRQKPEAPRRLPAPARPLTIPLVLGILAVVAGIAPPLAAALAGNRFLGGLGFCISGLLLPIAPLAWMAGLAAEQRRREQGLRVERRVVVGRLLGQWGTVLLAAEGTIGLLLVAALRLGGR